MTDQTPALPYFVHAPDFATPKRNTRVSYMYRDASNYKQHMEVVLEGAMTLEQAAAIDALLTGDDVDFLPLLVGLEPAGWSSDGGGSHYGDDHPWHELTMIEPTDAEAYGPTVGQFINAMEAAHAQGWEPGHATKWKLMRDGERPRYYTTYQRAFAKANNGDAVPFRIIPPLSEIFAD